MSRWNCSREICKCCGEITTVGFGVPDEMWRAVVPSCYLDSEICLRCFTRWADEKGVQWDHAIKLFPVSLISHRFEPATVIPPKEEKEKAMSDLMNPPLTRELDLERRAAVAEQMFRMKPFECLNSLPGISILAVPGGWVWENYANDGSGSGFCCFIPRPSAHEEWKWQTAASQLRQEAEQERSTP